MNDEMKPKFIKGEVQWAKVIDPGKNYSGELEWSIDVKTDIEPLRSLGLDDRIKPKDGFIKFHKSVFSKNKQNDDGSPKRLDPPKIFDSQLEPWDRTVGIGNGSICKVKLSLFPYDQHGGGVAFRLESLQVIKHVPYELKDPTEGFDKYDEEDDLPF
jgi:hypothetical protein